VSTNDSTTKNRRGFLKNAAVAGAAALSTGGPAEAAMPSATRRLKVGCIGVGAYSFTSYCWSDIIEADKPANNPKRGTFNTQLLNMDITHCWDIDAEANRAFAERMDAEAVTTYDGMVGKVDGVIFGGLYYVPWQTRIAKPYIEAGIPLYLSRPFAYSLRDIDWFLDLVAKHGTPIMMTAKFEHYNEAPALKKKLEKVGRILCVQATCNTSDYPIHFHLKYMMMKVLGYDVAKVSVIADADVGATYIQDTYIYPERDDRPGFSCVMQGCRNDDSFQVTVYGSDATVSAGMVRSPEWQDSLLFRYAPQVIDMQRTFEGNNYEPLDNIRKKTAVFLAGYKSFLEHKGAPVDVASLPLDWSPPHPKPGFIDEGMFKG